MTKEAFAAKPSLQTFLEATIAILGMELVKSSDPETVRLLLALRQQGKTPSEAASYFKFIRQARDTTNFESSLLDARNGLANHAYCTEQKVRAISEGITESMARGGPVDGLLNVSLSARELYHLKGLLAIYQEYAALLDIVYDATLSAEIALAVTKEDAISRLVNMTEAPLESEKAGAEEGLKNVIKIVTNML